MSQPRRRRRRRRSGEPGPAERSGQKTQRSDQKSQQQGQPGGQAASRRSRARARRGGDRSGGGQARSPKSSEDLVRARPGERPDKLTGRPDGQTLEQIIGELQTIWGVPESPQEYRLTVKVAEKARGRGRPATVEETIEDPSESSPVDPSAPRREKAPAAPRIGANVGRSERSSEERPEAGGRRKRAKRRRRGRGRGRGAGAGS